MNIACRLTLLFVLFLSYCNSLDGGFFFDDSVMVAPSRPDNWYASTFMWNRTVVHLTIAANFETLGRSPFGFHLVNVVIHLLVAITLFELIRSIGENVFRNDDARLVAFWTSLLWGVHPLNSQVVNYTAQRAESLMSLSYLLMLLTYAHYSRTGRRWMLGVSCIVFWIGAGCKEPIWLAPLMLPFFDWLVLRLDAAAVRRRWKIYLLYLVPGFAASLFFVPRYLTEGHSVGLGTGIHPFHYLITQSEVIAHYLRLVFWPSPLCFDYAWPVRTSPSQVFPAALVTVGLFAVTVVGVVRRDWRSFAGLVFFTVLAPTSSLLPVQDVAVEHRMYLPSACVLLIVVASITAALRSVAHDEPRSHRLIATTVFSIAVIAAAAKTHLRNRDYSTPASLWASVVQTAPNNPRGYSEYSNALLQTGQTEQAVSVALAGVQLPKAGPWQHLALAAALLQAGDLQQAGQHLQQAKALDSDLPGLHYHFGLLFDRLGRTAQAESHLLMAVARSSRHTEYLLTLAAVQADLGKLGESQQHLQKVLKQDPLHDRAHCNLGVLLAMRGEFAGAKRQFRHALRLNPDNREARDFLRRLNAEH